MRGNENRDHLFVSCNYFGSIWYAICGWLRISSKSLIDHLNQFADWEVFLKIFAWRSKMLWLMVVSIVWKVRNRRIFQHKEEHITSMGEHVKLLVYWRFKSKFVLFNFDYNFWRQNHMFFLTSVTWLLWLLFPIVLFCFSFSDL